MGEKEMRKVPRHVGIHALWTATGRGWRDGRVGHSRERRVPPHPRLERGLCRPVPTRTEGLEAASEEVIFNAAARRTEAVAFPRKKNDEFCQQGSRFQSGLVAHSPTPFPVPGPLLLLLYLLKSMLSSKVILRFEQFGGILSGPPMPIVLAGFLPKMAGARRLWGNPELA